MGWGFAAAVVFDVAETAELVGDSFDGGVGNGLSVGGGGGTEEEEFGR